MIHIHGSNIVANRLPSESTVQFAFFMQGPQVSRHAKECEGVLHVLLKETLARVGVSGM